MYKNCGGIGLSVTADGTVNGLEGNESRSLILKDHNGSTIAHWMPSTPWTSARLMEALEAADDRVAQHGVVTAYLGNEMIGCTEL